MKINQDQLIENIFKLDKIDNNKHTSLTQVCLLSIKSLIPSNVFIGNVMNDKRFIEEVKLWRFYQEGTVEMLSNVVSDKLLDRSYFIEDDNFYLRALVIIAANSEYKVSENELIKNLLMSSGDISTLLLWISINRLIFLTHEYKDFDKVLEELKEYIIRFSQSEYLKLHGELYKVDIKEYKKNYIIEFEKEKIQLINVLNGISSDKYLALFEIINYLSGCCEDIEIKSKEARIICLDMANIEIDKFYHAMTLYIERLRNGRIDPDDLIIEEYELPNIFKYDIGEEVYHTLLGTCKIIKKEVRENILTSAVNTKTGTYLFKARIS